MTISEAIKQHASDLGDSNILFVCDGWFVSVTCGVIHRASDTYVSWDEIEKIRLLQIKTSHSFQEQPWPFWGQKEFQQDWFVLGPYKAAICYAIGYLTIATWNEKAKLHSKNLYTN